MTKLANDIYQVLRTRTPAAHPEMSYSDLVAQLPSPFNTLDPDSELLASALGEIVLACRSRDLPALSAIVVHAAPPRVPGRGYYRVAHPNMAGDEVRSMVAWAQEFDRVKATTFPATL